MSNRARGGVYGDKSDKLHSGSLKSWPRLCKLASLVSTVLSTLVKRNTSERPAIPRSEKRRICSVSEHGNGNAGQRKGCRTLVLFAAIIQARCSTPNRCAPILPQNRLATIEEWKEYNTEWSITRGHLTGHVRVLGHRCPRYLLRRTPCQRQCFRPPGCRS